MTNNNSFENFESCANSSEFNRMIHQNPLILISANLPGCGSSSLANSIDQYITSQTGVKPDITSVGQDFRKLYGVNDEQDLANKMSKIPPAIDYDKQIYSGLNLEKPNIVEGKYATIAGPVFVENGPIVSVELTSNPITSTKRILKREEGKGIVDIFTETEPDGFLQYLDLLTKRAIHERDQREALIESSRLLPRNSNIINFNFDTSQYLTKELIDKISGKSSQFDENIPGIPLWEFNALQQVFVNLQELGVRLHEEVNPIDFMHFKHQIESIQYGLDRLTITYDRFGIEKLRDDIKGSITNAWYGLMMKKAPRFCVDSKTQEIAFDTKSINWSPEYYKIAEAWPILSAHLNNKIVLDPFAGAGTIMNLLMARGIPSRAIYSDIAYPNGMNIQGSTHNYLPECNVAAAQLLFDDLPSWYRPDFSKVEYHMASANKLDMLGDNSVDVVFSDPPYGKNLKEGGFDLVLDCLPELMRVSKEGAIMIVPMNWLKGLTDKKVKFEQLTKDLSRGFSHFPVCYIKILKPEQY